MRQHLVCVKAAQEICDAEVSGAKVGSASIIFKPQAVKAGDYEFSVGTAGSTMLIFQTVLPALVPLRKTSHLVFHGGTHNMMAPSFDYIAIAFVPLLKRMGIELEMKLQRHGFYPQGGGQWSATIYPVTELCRLDLGNAGKFIKNEAVITNANIPGHVAKRELDVISEKCGWSNEDMRIENVTALGGGNIVSLRLHHQHCSEVVEHVGRIGVSAERIARAAVKDLRRYQANGAVVGEHLADQLMLPMVVGSGGIYRTLAPSQHSKTNRDVIHMFTDKRIRFQQIQKDLWEIHV